MTATKPPTTAPIMILVLLESIGASGPPGPEHTAAWVPADAKTKQAGTFVTLVGEPWQEPLP
jgi:hypothetical protein